jgi:hypothetical protein
LESSVKMRTPLVVGLRAPAHRNPPTALDGTLHSKELVPSNEHLHPRYRYTK